MIFVILTLGIAAAAVLGFFIGTLSGTAHCEHEDAGAPLAVPVGRHAAAMPRRRPMVNRQPWQTAQNPALRDQPVVPAWAPEAVYGADRCQLDVAEAERLAEVMRP